MVASTGGRTGDETGFDGNNDDSILNDCPELVAGRGEGSRSELGGWDDGIGGTDPELPGRDRVSKSGGGSKPKKDFILLLRLLLLLEVEMLSLSVLAAGGMGGGCRGASGGGPEGSDELLFFFCSLDGRL